MKATENATSLRIAILLKESMPFVLPTRLTTSPDTAIREWATSLPQHIKAVTQKWDITPIALHHATIHNLVLTGQKIQKPVFLKCMRSPAAFHHEITALRFFAPSVPALLGVHTSFHIFLMDAVKPGHSLEEMLNVDEAKAYTIFSDVVTALHTAKVLHLYLHPLHNLKMPF